MKMQWSKKKMKMSGVMKMRRRKLCIILMKIKIMFLMRNQMFLLL